MPREGFSRKRWIEFHESREWNAAATSASLKNNLTHMRDRPMRATGFMRQNKKRWIKPTLKTVPIFFECTCYAGAL
jgi:hypothetical protein